MERINTSLEVIAGVRAEPDSSENRQTLASKPLTEPTVPDGVLENPLERPIIPGHPIVSTPEE